MNLVFVWRSVCVLKCIFVFSSLSHSMVFTECVASLCPCGSRCSNQRFQKRQWSSNVERFLVRNFLSVHITASICVFVMPSSCG